jgi:hypothetical protein
VLHYPILAAVSSWYFQLWVSVEAVEECLVRYEHILQPLKEVVCAVVVHSEINKLPPSHDVSASFRERQVVRWITLGLIRPFTVLPDKFNPVFKRVPEKKH